MGVHHSKNKKGKKSKNKKKESDKIIKKNDLDTDSQFQSQIEIINKKNINDNQNNLNLKKKNTELSKIKSKYIFETIFSYIKEDDFILRLFINSKSLKEKSGITIFDYQFNYLKRTGINLFDYFNNEKKYSSFNEINKKFDINIITPTFLSFYIKKMPKKKVI